MINSFKKMSKIFLSKTKLTVPPSVLRKNNVKECKFYVNVPFLCKETPNFDAMNKKINLNIGILALLICLACGSLYAFLGHDAAVLQQQQRAQRIHLALRRTAHLLLKQTGDSTSTIAPIQQTNETTYLVNLEHTFNYDSLPTFLQNSFDLQEITSKYDVAVRNCHQEELLLGYSSFDFLKNKNVPCVGRNQPKGCLNFSVTFKDPSVASFLAMTALDSMEWVMLYGGLFIVAIASMAYFFYKYSKKEMLISSSITPISVQKTDDASLIYIGQTIFDTHKHTLLIHNMEQKLTFQEAQLLQLFCEHKNELLERDFILKTVWGDEGVLITRSVDVFVSRLRQLLKADTTLKIVNVYNRGYRFEAGDGQL
jgi:DNA-binding response OmpR family regulator